MAKANFSKFPIIDYRCIKCGGGPLSRRASTCEYPPRCSALAGENASAAQSEFLLSLQAGKFAFGYAAKLINKNGGAKSLQDPLLKKTIIGKVGDALWTKYHDVIGDPERGCNPKEVCSLLAENYVDQYGKNARFMITSVEISGIFGYKNISIDLSDNPNLDVSLIIGTNGSGKSTLFRLLFSVMHPLTIDPDSPLFNVAGQEVMLGGKGSSAFRADFYRGGYAKVRDDFDFLMSFPFSSIDIRTNNRFDISFNKNPTGGTYRIEALKGFTPYMISVDFDDWKSIKDNPATIRGKLQDLRKISTIMWDPSPFVYFIGANRYSDIESTLPSLLVAYLRSHRSNIDSLVSNPSSFGKSETEDLYRKTLSVGYEIDEDYHEKHFVASPGVRSYSKERKDFSDRCRVLAQMFRGIFNDVDYKEIVFGPRLLIRCVALDSKKRIVHDQLITIDDLSSGELNYFVILYRIIIDGERNGLILVDEPEISTHIELQQRIVDELIFFSQKYGFQVMASTHSPFIGAGHEDITVALNEKIEDSSSDE